MNSIKDKNLRHLGFSFAAACLIGAGLIYWRHHYWNWPILSLGLLLGLCAEFLPKLLSPLEKVIRPLLDFLTLVYQALILGLFFFLVITPLALYFKLAGRELLKLKFTPEATYLEKSLPRPADHMLKPY